MKYQFPRRLDEEECDMACQVKANADAIATNAVGLDVGWMIVAGSFVFLMQAGFGLLEAGFVRTKNQQAIIFKGMFDITAAALCWWLLGNGLAFGEDNSDADLGGGFLGTTKYAILDEDALDTELFGAETAAGSGYAFFFFQWTFCATCATIISGAVAERIHLAGYAVIAVYMTALVYPIVVHWTWGGGWLYYYGGTSDEPDAAPGFNDFAGSGVVHMCGGFAALACAILLGPRLGRFSSKGPGAMCCGAGWDEANAAAYERNSAPLGGSDSMLGRPTNPLMVFLGTFLLWFGWYGFNAGSTVALSGGSSLTSARCVCTTMMAASCGGLSYTMWGMMMAKASGGSELFTVAGYGNGILGGLVAITAGCANVDLHSAVLIGAIGGIVVDLATRLEQKLKIDDVVGAWPVHGASGVWGVFANGLWDMTTGAISGTSEGTENGTCLPAQVVGFLAIGAWAFFMVIPIVIVMNGAGMMRATIENETQGMDYEFQQANYAAGAKAKSNQIAHMSSAN